MSEQERQHEALLEAGQLAGVARLIDAEALLAALAVNSGPAFYLESIQATLNFINDLRRVEREHGAGRIELDVVPVVLPRDDAGPA